MLTSTPCRIPTIALTLLLVALVIQMLCFQWKEHLIYLLLVQVWTFLCCFHVVSTVHALSVLFQEIK